MFEYLLPHCFANVAGAQNKDVLHAYALLEIAMLGVAPPATQQAHERCREANHRNDNRSRRQCVMRHVHRAA